MGLVAGETMNRAAGVQSQPLCLAKFKLPVRLAKSVTGNPDMPGGRQTRC
jgi:hypothetical protein